MYSGFSYKHIDCKLWVWNKLVGKYKEYPEYVGHFLLEFFIINDIIIKKIPEKNDQFIQRTP